MLQAMMLFDFDIATPRRQRYMLLSRYIHAADAAFDAAMLILKRYATRFATFSPLLSMPMPYAAEDAYFLPHFA